jgi:hypothetical protein
MAEQEVQEKPTNSDSDFCCIPLLRHQIKTDYRLETLEKSSEANKEWQHKFEERISLEFANVRKCIEDTREEESDKRRADIQGVYGKVDDVRVELTTAFTNIRTEMSEGLSEVR